MKRIISVFLALMCFASNGIVMAEEKQESSAGKIEIHVSPKGVDSNDGSVNKPLKTLEGARNAVKKYNDGKTPIDVIFHEGEYRILKTVNFSREDSGTEKAPITYRGAEGEEVIFKGSVELDATKFEPVTDKGIYARLPESSRKHIGQLDLGAQGITSFSSIPVGASGHDRVNYNNFYLDGQMQTLAKWPNDGYTQMQKLISTNTFQMKESVASRWGSATNAFFGGYPGWNYAYDRTEVTAINTEARQITINTKNCTTSKISQGDARYYIYNLMEEIDMPGEWYIDTKTKMLYYYPMFPLEGKSFEMAVLKDPMIKLTDVSYINFSGITFTQACGDAINIKNINHVTFDKNIFKNLGRYGVFDANKNGNENYNVTFSNSYFLDLGSMPITISGGNLATLEPSNILIYNCYFNNFGYERKSYSGTAIAGVGAKILNNIFCGSKGAALQLNGNNHEVMYNEIYDVCNEASDMGAIYTGRNVYWRGNKVRYNYIHDLIPDPVTAGMICGVYWDDKLAGNYVEYNIFENIPRGTFMNGGSDHKVNNNIYVDCPSGIQVGTGGNNYIERQDLFIAAKDWADQNPVYYEQYPEMKTIDINYTIPRRNKFNDCLYVNTGFSLVSGEYIKYGDDDYSSQVSNIVTVDSFNDFKDAENGDYTIKEGSEILEKIPGLANIKMEEIGLVGEMKENWKADSFRKLYPKNGATEVSASNVVLTWQIPGNACRYHVEVAEDAEFKNIVWETDTAFNYARPENIKTGGKTYYWNVKAYTNATTHPLEYMSLGSAYTFTTSILEQLDQVILTDAIKNAESLASGLVEGKESGQCEEGKLQPFLDLIAQAKTLNKKRYGSQVEVEEMVEKLTGATNGMPQYIHKGYGDMDKLLSSESYWMKDSVAEIKDGMIDMQAGYFATAGNIENYELYRFKMKLEGESGYATIAVRLSDMGTPWSGKKNYSFYFKKNLIEFQRYTGHGGGIIETYENNGLVPYGEWNEIEVAALDVEGGVQVILKSNGKVITNYLDESGALSAPGKLQFGITNIESIQIKKSDNTEPFDESTLKTGVKIYTEEELVTVDKAELLKGENYTLANATAQATDSGLLIKGNEEKNESIAFSKKLDGNEVYDFDVKLNINEATQGFKLRSSYLEQSPVDEEFYKIEITKDTVSLIRHSLDGNQILCRYDNEKIRSGEWFNAKLCAYPTEHGMRVVMLADGEKIIDYTDMYSKIKSGYLKFVDDAAKGIEIR